MRVYLKRRNRRVNLIMGLVWVIYVPVMYLLSEDFDAYQIGFTAIGLVYLYVFWFQRKRGFLRIDEHQVATTDPFFAKKIPIDQITSVRRFAGDYIFKGGKKEISFDTRSIDVDSLEALNQKIEELGIPWS